MADDLEPAVPVQFAVESSPSVGQTFGELMELKPTQLESIKQRVTDLIVNFVPPKEAVARRDVQGMQFRSFEVQLGFKIVVETDGLIRLLFSKAGGEAAIQVKATWEQK